jgi:hypothetical protein
MWKIPKQSTMVSKAAPRRAFFRTFDDVDGQIPAMPREIDGIPTTNGKVELLGDRRDFCVDDSGSFYILLYIYIWIV